jgi:hypothetical protein
MKHVIVVVLFSLVAVAAVAAPPASLRQLDYFMGTWQCSGMAYKTPMAPEHPTRAVVTTKWILGGNWLSFMVAEEKTAQNPMPFAVDGYFGFDPELKMFVIGSVDSGGGYSTAQSKGWMGDVITFEGPWHMGTVTMTGRDTFTKKGAGQMVHVALVQQKGGPWQKVGEDTCNRKK